MPNIRFTFQLSTNTLFLYGTYMYLHQFPAHIKLAMSNLFICYAILSIFIFLILKSLIKEHSRTYLYII